MDLCLKNTDEPGILTTARLHGTLESWMSRSNCRRNKSTSDLLAPSTPVFKQPLPTNDNTNLSSHEMVFGENFPPNWNLKCNSLKKHLVNELQRTPSVEITAQSGNSSNVSARKTLRSYYSTPDCKDLMLSTDKKLSVGSSALKQSRLSGMSWEERSRLVGLPRRVKKEEVEEDDDDDDYGITNASKTTDNANVEDSFSSFCPLNFNSPQQNLEKFNKNLERRKANFDDNASYVKVNERKVSVDDTTIPSPAKESVPLFRNHSLKELNNPVQVTSQTPNCISSEINKTSSSSFSKIADISNGKKMENKENCPISLEKETKNPKQIRRLKPFHNMTLEVNGNTYSVLNKLGQGASSLVFQVYDSRNKTTSAIKCVNLDKADEATAAGFKQEITLLQKLQDSDRVVKLIDFEHKENENKLYIVMERGDTNMRDVLRDQAKQGQIPSESMKYYWAEMLRAVAVIHKAGIIHCDLKPANFLFVKGKIKLIDFGIASSIQPDMTSVMLDSVGGTPNFMSPEAVQILTQVPEYNANGMVDRKKKMNAKADVWSLGCILYSLVYGKPPFDNIKSDIGKMYAISNPECKISFPNIQDQSLLDVIKKCLIRDPKLRPSIDELLAHPYLKPTSPITENLTKEATPLIQQLENLTPRRMQQVSEFLKHIANSKS